MKVKSSTEQNVIEESTQQTSSELVKVIEMDEKPFHLVSTDNGKSYSLAFGNYLLTENQFKNNVDATKWLKKNTWEIMLKVIMIVIEKQK